MGKLLGGLLFWGSAFVFGALFGHFLIRTVMWLDRIQMCGWDQKWCNHAF